MAISYTLAEHNVAFPSKVAASAGSPHIYNIRLTADTDNGQLVTKGAWVDFDEYNQGSTAPTFSGLIVAQAKNGDWYVEVTAATEALFVFDSPVIAEDYNKKFTAEKNFYNERGKTVKAYSLIKGDIIQLSAHAFDKTPVANKTVTYSNGKYVVAS